LSDRCAECAEASIRELSLPSRELCSRRLRR
jgi:hypothetical protein